MSQLHGEVPGICDEPHIVGRDGVRGEFAWFSHRLWRGNREFASGPDVLYGSQYSGARVRLSEPTIQQPDDVNLLRSIANGDPDALRQLYERHSVLLFSLALKILSDHTEAEDVLQEAFVQVWKSAGLYDVMRGTPVGWLILLVRSRAIDRRRSRHSRDRTSEAYRQEPVADPPLPAHEAGAAETGALVRQAMSALPSEQRVPIELAYFSGLTQTEIAVKLGEPLGTVKTRMRTGLLRLREQLAQTGGVR